MHLKLLSFSHLTQISMASRRIVRPQGITRCWKQLSQSINLHQRRSIHKVPFLGGQNNEKGEVFSQHGVPGFVSSRTFQQGWGIYQKHLVDEINEKVGSDDSPYADKSPYQLHVEFSRQPEYTDFYNTVAMAHFNHLWWESLSADEKSVPDQVLRDIETDFHDLASLRDEMLEHGDAMFGNGFVWLVKEYTPYATSHAAHQKMRIFCTYNAGSPYTEAWRMRQSRDPGMQLDPEAQRRAQMTQVQNRVGSFGANSQQGKDGNAIPNPLYATPLLCLNVWQHMWVPDYGILGKKSYMAAWWERIDWDVVATRHQQVARANLGRG